MLRKYKLTINDTTINVEVEGPKKGMLTITIGEATFPVNVAKREHNSGVYRVTVGDTKHTITLKPNPDTSDYTLEVHRETYAAALSPISDATTRSYRPTTITATPSVITTTSPHSTTVSQEIVEPGTITAPLPGRVLEVRVKEGETIRSGDVILVLEAMKMANEIRAPQSGTVDKVHVQAGTTVEKGQPMVDIK